VIVAGRIADFDVAEKAIVAMATPIWSAWSAR
jgi:hypothetical protein